MAQLPPALIFVNSQLNQSLFTKIAQQLLITETISESTFMTRLTTDPDYVKVIDGYTPDGYDGYTQRILVVANDFINSPVRQVADIVLSVVHGLASILKNNIGPTGLTFQVDRMNLYSLLRYNGSKYVTILKSTANCCDCSACQCGYLVPSFSGAFGAYCYKCSIYCNSDNECNNEAFRNRS